jgi:hypothetical protein
MFELIRHLYLHKGAIQPARWIEPLCPKTKGSEVREKLASRERHNCHILKELNSETGKEAVKMRK